MTTTITERVTAGAEFLDQAEPGWWQHIDIDRLDLASPCRCVLGQLEIALRSEDPKDNAYVKGLDHYDTAEPMAMGFNAPYYSDEFDALTAAWRDLIQARRQASGLDTLTGGLCGDCAASTEDHRWCGAPRCRCGCIEARREAQP